MIKIKRANNFIDLTGKRFGRLTVVKLGKIKNKKKTYWICKCDCGNFSEVYSCKLKTGHTRSCGCLFTELCTKHGDHKTKFYRTWGSIKSRCGKRNNYINISVCKRWLKYENFKADMYTGYIKHSKKYGEKNTTIDRLDSKKGYYKNNCHWATYGIQGNNTSRNVFFEYKGKTMTAAQWRKKFNSKINRHTFIGRLHRGWDIKEAASKNLMYNYKK